jgi:hypothetical protein
MIIKSASVKVMRSYDYCHFEIQMAIGEEAETAETIQTSDVDLLRKEAMRLADKAVKQYQIHKRVIEESIQAKTQVDYQLKKATAIKENFPKSEWTPEQKAQIKLAEEILWMASRDYDYEDEWDSRPPED